jgi:hypothetical protein
LKVSLSGRREWLLKAGPKHIDDFNCGLSIASFLRIEPSSLVSFLNSK